MEIEIDSFAANPLNNDTDSAISSYHALAELLERMVYADAVDLDTFEIGEHHRKEFLDSALAVILAAVAARSWAGNSASSVGQANSNYRQQ